MLLGPLTKLHHNGDSLRDALNQLTLEKDALAETSSETNKTVVKQLGVWRCRMRVDVTVLGSVAALVGHRPLSNKTSQVDATLTAVRLGRGPSTGICYAVFAARDWLTACAQVMPADIFAT